jgi:hypothetical protein
MVAPVSEPTDTDPVRAALSIPVKIEELMRLDGRVAVVTGISSGLGQRFARVLDAAGREGRSGVAATRCRRRAGSATAGRCGGPL